MKLRLGSKASQEALEALCRWMPSLSPAFRKMAGECPLGLELEVNPVKPKRTGDQNARYWAIVGALGDYVGMSKAEMHNEVLGEYHGFDLVEFRGSTHKRPRGRSHNLSRQTFSDLMAIAERWAGEMGVHWEEQ